MGSPESPSLPESSSLPNISHQNPEVNKRLQEVIEKVLKVLEYDPELQKDFTEKFKSVFNKVTNDPGSFNTLIESIENKMISELNDIHRLFLMGSLLSNEAKEESKKVITKYIHMEQFAFKNSLPK